MISFQYRPRLTKFEIKQRDHCDISALREKCPNTKFFLVRIFLSSDWIRRFTENVVFSPNAGKYGPEKTPYLDTFHAVILLSKVHDVIKTINCYISIVMSFHQKTRRKFCTWLQLSGTKLCTDVATSCRKGVETIEYWKSWQYPFFTPLKFN